MELKIARRGSGCSVFDRLGTPNNRDTDRNRNRNSVGNVVCIFWRNGRCRKNPCRFLHSVSENETEAKRPVNCGSGGVQIQIEGVPNGSEHNPYPRKKFTNNTWVLSKYPVAKNVVQVVASESEHLYCPRKRPHCVVTDKTLVLSKYPVVEDEVEVVASESERLFPPRKRPHCVVTENTLVLNKSPVPDHEDCPCRRKKPQVPDHNKSEDELQNVVAAKSEEEKDVPNNSLPTVANNPSSKDEDVTPSKSLGTFVESTIHCQLLLTTTATTALLKMKILLPASPWKFLLSLTIYCQLLLTTTALPKMKLLLPASHLKLFVSSGLMAIVHKGISASTCIHGFALMG